MLGVMVVGASSVSVKMLKSIVNMSFHIVCNV